MFNIEVYVQMQNYFAKEKFKIFYFRQNTWMRSFKHFTLVTWILLFTLNQTT